MEESDEEVSFSDPMIVFIIDDTVLSFPADSYDDVIVLILQYFFIHVRYSFSLRMTLPYYTADRGMGEETFGFLILAFGVFFAKKFIIKPWFAQVT